MGKERIFVLDDEERISSLCSRVLTRRGYRVIAPAYGEDAFIAARKGQYDLLLTDYQMPDRNGIELFRSVRAINEALACALMTAHATAEVITQALEAGVDAFVPKPFTVDELIRGVECALSKRRLQKENAWLKRMVSLLELHIRVALGPEERSVFDITADIVGRRIGADRVTLMTCTDDPAALRIEAGRNLPADCRPGEMAGAAGTIAGYVLENGKQVMIGDRPLPMELSKRLRFSELGSGMCVPLRARNRTLGVLSASLLGTSGRYFTEADLRVLGDIAENVGEINRKLSPSADLRSRSYEKIENMIGDIDGRDYFSKNHSSYVSLYAVKLARAMGLPDQAVEEIRVAGLLHDVGKLGLPEHLIRAKNIPVTEVNELQAHVSHGEEILTSAELPDGICLAVRHHHERFDGNGYPDGLAAEGIPLLARILSVADTMDAITSDRQYRPRLRPEGVREELKRVKGNQLDPGITDLALELYSQGELLNPDHPHTRELR